MWWSIIITVMDRDNTHQSYWLRPPHHQETASAWTCSWYGERLIHISVPSQLDGAEGRALRQAQSLRWRHCWGGQWPSSALPAPPRRHYDGEMDSVGLSSRFLRCSQLGPRCSLWQTGAQSSSCLVNQIPPGEQQVSTDDEDGNILKLFDIHLLIQTQRHRQITPLYLWLTIFCDT